MSTFHATEKPPLAQKNCPFFINDKHWLTTISQRSPSSYRTLLRWWQAFCQENGLKLRPMQAEAAHRDAFSAWLAERGQEEQATQEAAQAQRHLLALAQRYGATWLVAEVLRPTEEAAREQERAQMAEALRKLKLSEA